MTIMDKATHTVEWRADAEENWMGEGWAVVPEELREAALACGGACDITLNEAGDRVVAIVPTERPAAPDPIPSQAALDRADLEYVAAMAGVALTQGDGSTGGSSGGDEVMDPMGGQDSDAYTAAKRYYPGLWTLWRLEALKTAGKLTQGEYDELVKGAGT